MIFIFPIILGISSSQLTLLFFGGEGQPPTRKQPKDRISVGVRSWPLGFHHENHKTFHGILMGFYHQSWNFQRVLSMKQMGYELIPLTHACFRVVLPNILSIVIIHYGKFPRLTNR